MKENYDIEHIADLCLNYTHPLSQENKQLAKRVGYLEGVLSEIIMFNALGKTLKINEAIHAAIDITE